MGNIIKLSKHKRKGFKDPVTNQLLAELNTIKELWWRGELKNIIVIGELQDGIKVATSNSLNLGEAKKMAKHFLDNAGEYVD